MALRKLSIVARESRPLRRCARKRALSTAARSVMGGRQREKGPEPTFYQ
jgi:hypothetical protein